MLRKYIVKYLFFSHCPDDGLNFHWVEYTIPVSRQCWCQFCEISGPLDWIPAFPHPFRLCHSDVGTFFFGLTHQYHIVVIKLPVALLQWNMGCTFLQKVTCKAYSNMPWGWLVAWLAHNVCRVQSVWPRILGSPACLICSFIYLVRFSHIRLLLPWSFLASTT